MESFRPDQEDVRARQAGVPPRRSAVSVNAETPVATTVAARSGGQKMLNMLLAMLVLLMGIWSWLQYSDIQRLSSQLDDAQGYIRQGTLLLARFEGQLTDTGADIAETGDALKDRLARLEGEIRKLWVLANERNRKDIAAQAEALKTFEKQLGGQSKSLEDVNARFENLRQQVQEDTVRFQQLRNELATLSASLKDLAGLQPEQKKLAQSASQMAGDLAAIKDRQRAFEGQQLLSREELTARIGVLEQKPAGTADAAALARLRAKVEKMDEILTAVDAGRAQFTSRWVSIEQRLSNLESASRH